MAVPESKSASPKRKMTDDEMEHPPLGNHLFLDMAGMDEEALNDPAFLEQACKNIIAFAGMTMMSIHSHHLDPQGVSTVAVLMESHLSIHTWPERQAAMVDLFTCGDSCNLEDAVPKIIEEFKGCAEQTSWSLQKRNPLRLKLK